ncbi:MAG: phospho-N-acetylmuramoyl-pentapeptide-transferase [Candidatus Latescibacterota bacterium]|nr:MAG: phospho-N-acetylmuramoyl-pentapeptide-transferase [Candidatus Latescibacterota bacterium]
MLYWLLYPLHEHFIVFNVLRYITFRSAYAMVTALVISFLLGPWFMRKLRALQGRAAVREDTPISHQMKVGTPSMGGLLIVASIVIPVLLWGDLSNHYVRIVLLATLWMAAIGFLDDYMKIVRRAPKGLVGRYKLIGQVVVGLAIGSMLYFLPQEPELATRTSVPFLKNVNPDFGFLYIFFVALVITGSSNAVNLADGLDGLAIGLCALAFLAFAGLAYVTGNRIFSDYLNILYLRGSGELTVLCMAAVGAALGFLWYNTHPAEMFMGDTGSLALGGALGTVAVLVKKEFLLVLIGGVLVLEALSVMIQVFAYRWRRKRVFRMAPLHHHFELLGWPETKIVVRFWIIAALLVMLSLSTIKLQ